MVSLFRMSQNNCLFTRFVITVATSVVCVWSLVSLVGTGKFVASTLTCFSLKGCLCQFADGCI